MREHFSTDALRWYWGDNNLRTRAKRMIPNVAELNWMEMAEIRKLPDWVIPIQNSKLIISRTGGAFLVDCGYVTDAVAGPGWRASRREPPQCFCCGEVVSDDLIVKLEILKD